MDISEFRRRCKEFITESEAVIGDRLPWWYSAKLSEEAGEATKAYNRFSGMSRKTGTVEDLAYELTDVIYSAFILAEKLGIDLGDYLDESFREVMTRGFGEVT